jgi:hypothetical protein
MMEFTVCVSSMNGPVLRRKTLGLETYLGCLHTLGYCCDATGALPVEKSGDLDEPLESRRDNVSLRLWPAGAGAPDVT